MSTQCKDSKINEKPVCVAMDKETKTCSYSTIPAQYSVPSGYGTNQMETFSPTTEKPCSIGLSHFTNSSPKSIFTHKEKSSQLMTRPTFELKPLTNVNELTFSEMKSFISSEINFSNFNSLIKIFEEISQRCLVLENFDQRKEALALVLKIFEIFNTRRQNLRQRISPQEYEIFFRTVFAWNEPIFVFELACIEFEYSKKTDKNFKILISHLTNNIQRIDPHTYLRLFIRLTYFVNVHFKSMQASLKSLKINSQKNLNARKMILTQLESLNEFKELIKINKIELFREKQHHHMNSQIPILIHKAMRLTGDFPYSDFEIINRNLARIFYLYCCDSASLSTERFWNCVTFSINMFPNVPLSLCSSVLKNIIKHVSLFKVLQSFLLPFNSKPSSGNMSLILKIFRFKANPDKPLKVAQEVIAKIEKFSCYNEQEFKKLLEEHKTNITNYIDPMIYLFKKLMTICLNGFYFLQMIIHGNPDFEQLNLLKSTEDIYKQFLRLGVSIGIQLTRHSKRISMSSREILKFIESKVKATSIEKQKLMKTVIKIKRAYESVFSFMDSKRKLYNFVRLSQKMVDQDLFNLMSLFIY
jgi:hypothetical protein